MLSSAVSSFRYLRYPRTICRCRRKIFRILRCFHSGCAVFGCSHNAVEFSFRCVSNVVLMCSFSSSLVVSDVSFMYRSVVLSFSPLVCGVPSLGARQFCLSIELVWFSLRPHSVCLSVGVICAFDSSVLRGGGLGCRMLSI